MTSVWMTLMALAIAMSVDAADGQARITVWLENEGLTDAMVLVRAQGEAIQIFAQVGVKVDWRVGEPGKKAAAGENLEIVFDAEAPARFDRAALAYATVGTAGIAIHIFYNRVICSHERKLAPALLGHVMAHEITHVLEGVARHSEEGLMKAAWDIHDYAAMLERPLPFADIDMQLVRGHFGLTERTN